MNHTLVGILGPQTVATEAAQSLAARGFTVFLHDRVQEALVHELTAGPSVVVLGEIPGNSAPVLRLASKGGLIIRLTKADDMNTYFPPEAWATY